MPACLLSSTVYSQFRVALYVMHVSVDSILKCGPPGLGQKITLTLSHVKLKRPKKGNKKRSEKTNGHLNFHSGFGTETYLNDYTGYY